MKNVKVLICLMAIAVATIMINGCSKNEIIADEGINNDIITDEGLFITKFESLIIKFEKLN